MQGCTEDDENEPKKTTSQRLLGIPTWHAFSSNPMVLVGLSLIPLPSPQRPHLLNTGEFHGFLSGLMSFGALDNAWFSRLPHITHFEPEALLVLQSAAEDLVEEAYVGAYAMKQQLLGKSF